MQIPKTAASPTVAVIGAGISGLGAARKLHDNGIQVVIFDKGRGVGGRMATRRVESGLRFDHGAQYFTARDASFECYVRSWLADGIIARWDGHVGVISHGEISVSEHEHERFVGVPAMNAVCKHLARDLDVRVGVRVAPLAPNNGHWSLHDQDGGALGTFDWIIVTAPAPQTANLLAGAAPQLAAKAAAVSMQSCWAVMAGFVQKLPLPLDGAFVHDSPLAWAARNSSKPRREDNTDCWVLHANPHWSDEHMESDKDEVCGILLSEFWRSTKLDEVEPVYLTAHRWRFAIPCEPLPDRCLDDSQIQVSVCGDWCSGPRVEGAFLSGMAAASMCLIGKGRGH